MADTATLQLKVDSSQAKKAGNELDKLSKKGAKAERGSKKLSTGFKIFGGVVAGLATGKLVSDFLAVNVQFEKLNANLLTVTGSANLADAAFKNIQSLASKLPFQVSELTQAFISLRNFGLDGSEEALLSFADTAAATGKSLQQFIEAVADAATFEFERLKEFGIKTKQEGDKVKFTFRGITTEVEKSSDSVQKFLIGLGQQNFLGAAETQAKGLAGAISNLGDEYDNLLNVIGKTGVASGTADIFRQIGRGLGVVSDAIEDTPIERLAEIEEKMSDLANTNLELLSSGKRMSASEKRLSKARQNHIGFLIKERDAINDKLSSQREEVKVANDLEAAQKKKNTLAREEEKRAKERDKLDPSLTALKDLLDDELSVELRALTNRQNIIKSSQEAGLINKIRANDLLLKSDKEYAASKKAIELESANASNKILSDSQTAQVGAAGQIAGNLAAIAKEGGKDQFDNYKAFASAQAAISAGLAITGVLAQSAILGPLAIPLAASIGALAAVQVAQIQSQEYSPRALGGQMKSGGSFLVGERGPELVTMGNRNANIQSAGSFGGGGSITNTNVFQISAGVEGTVQAEIARFVPIFQQIAIDSVNSSARRGGQTARTVGRRRG